MRVVIRRCLVEILAQLPRPPRAKEREEPEEDSRQLQPQHARELHERSPGSFAKTLAATDDALPGLFGLVCRTLHLLPNA